MYSGGDPEKPRILLLAPTGVAAININGTKIHSGLGIDFGSKLFPFNDRQRQPLRNNFSEVRLIIIDETSMYQVYCFFKSTDDLMRYLDIQSKNRL